ncbi:MAG: serine hydrolase [Acidobacteria bacterium]|nr:serine hydrolase [Acidobacteriota bacterium]
MSVKHRFLFVAVFLLMAVSGSTAQDKATPAALRVKDSKEQIVKRLDAAIPRLLEDGLVPGLSIALLQKGELVWHKGYGVKNVQTKEPVADNTAFEAASLSKPVFAYAVLKLVDAGKLDLDTPLTKYLPGNYDVGDDARINQITARHVLSHRPGFPNWRRPNNPLTIHFTPGERFSYSGEGFVYLSKVVEKITGESFNDFMKRSVFVPLGMNNSSYVWQANYETQQAFSHSSLGQPTGVNKSTQSNAAASLRTTAEDYGKFLAAVVKGKGLKNATWRQMFTPQIYVSESGTNNIGKAPEKLSTSIAWGLGWGLQTTADGLAFWHWGDNGNTKAFVVVYDKQQFGMVVFTDGANGLTIVPELVSEAIGGEQPALSWLKYGSYKSPARALLKTILAKGAAAALGEYRQTRKGRPESEVLNEAQMNRLGYDLLGAQRAKDAIEIFKQNVEDYPQSSNVYDSLGEAYANDGQTELAIKNYQRSLELDPKNENAVGALKKLQGKQ